jgi:Flp pilus assembly protein TadG
MVEFAIVVTVLLLIVVGVLYFGRYLSYSTDMTHLANEAARFQAVNVNPGAGSQTLDQYVQKQAFGELANGSNDVSKLQVWIYPNGGGTTAGQNQPLTACVQATFHFLPILNLPNVTITRSATLVAEVTSTTPDSTSAATSAGCPT